MLPVKLFHITFLKQQWWNLMPQILELPSCSNSNFCTTVSWCNIPGLKQNWIRHVLKQITIQTHKVSRLERSPSSGAKLPPRLNWKSRLQKNLKHQVHTFIEKMSDGANQIFQKNFFLKKPTIQWRLWYCWVRSVANKWPHSNQSRTGCYLSNCLDGGLGLAKSF